MSTIRFCHRTPSCGRWRSCRRQLLPPIVVHLRHRQRCCCCQAATATTATIACHLVVPLSHPLIVLSLRCQLVVSSRRLVVVMPLVAPPSRHPLTAPPSHRLALAACCIASHHAALLSSCCASLSSFCHPITVPPSCCLISLAGYCVASHCIAFLSSSPSATLSLSCSGWLLRQLSLRRPFVLTSCHPLVLSFSYHWADLLLSHCTSWLLRCLSLHCPLVVLSPRCPLVFLIWLVVALPPVMPPSHPLVVPSSCHFFILSLRPSLVVSSHWLVVALPLVKPPSRRPFAPPLSRRLVPAGCCVNSCRAALLSSRHATSLSSCLPITTLTSCHLIALAGCCIASRHTALLLSSQINEYHQ